MRLAFFWVGISTLFLALALLACGGGSGGFAGGPQPNPGPNPTPNPPPYPPAPPPAIPGAVQGIYTGFTSNQNYGFRIILPGTDGEFTAIYSDNSSNGACGMITGPGTLNNGKFTANFHDYSYCGSTLQVYTGTLDASFTSSSISGTIDSGSGFVGSFTGTANQNFDPDAPALVSDISGSWKGSLIDGETATINVNLDGTATGTIGHSGCAFSATIAPDPSGKNLFDVSVAFGGSPCKFPNQIASGIAISTGAGHGLLAAVRSGSSFGIALTSNR